MDTKPVKEQILVALSHPEAEDGLFLYNFTRLHEEDERPPVEATPAELEEAISELIEDGLVVVEDSEEGLVFRLSRQLRN